MTRQIKIRKSAILRSGFIAGAGALMIAGPALGVTPVRFTDPATMPINGEQVASGKTDRLMPAGEPARCAGQGYGGYRLDCTNAIYARQKLATVQLYNDPRHATSYWVRSIDTVSRHVSRVIAY